MCKRSISQIALLFCLIASVPVFSQSGKGVITGVAKDSAGAVLQGAKVELQPQVRPVTTDGQGEFAIPGVAPGTYTVTISYVGFAAYTGSVTVIAGQTAQIDAVLKVASAGDEVVVTADRPRGEAEAINRTLAAENILQVLPADVIVSLPNANIADALGHMASVSVERDEGEAKYVQIRGTEPRLSNTMVDGVTIPSPESGVRQIKLDTIASDLVDSVEINKTLQANIDADGIGGSVNLVTKTASETPTIVLYGVGGYTPIDNGRTVSQLGGTVGRRFGPDKKLGALLGGTYDYNGRGINDTEPFPDPTSATPHYTTQDLRNYVYDRTRWGLTGSADYNLGQGSDISLRGIFTNFRNWGDDQIHTLNDHAFPTAGQSRRRPNMVIASLALEGKHNFSSSWLTWTVAASRARSLGGYGGANYGWVGDQNLDCHNDQSLAKSVYRPGWAGCFGTGQDDVTSRDNYGLTELDLPTFGQSVQLNLQAAASFGTQYHFGTRYGTFEFGGKIRNAHKFDNTFNKYWTVPVEVDESGNPILDSNGNTIPIPIPDSAHPEWNSDFTNPDYYDKTYPAGTYTDWAKVYGWVLKNQSQLVTNVQSYPNSNNFDLIERIPAGYLMNTIELASRVRLVTGVRFEATHVDTLSFDSTASTLSFHAGGDYLNVLPSASLRFAVDKDSDLRLVYGRGLARPDPQDLSAAVSQPTLNQTPVTISLGNPNLKAEQANNYDVLYERTFSHTGLLQAGYFYKDLTDPIVSTQYYSTKTFPDVPAGSTVLVSQSINAGSAYVQGFEIGFQQRMAYLPSVMGGLGLSANYSHTASSARDLPLRTDQPALLRDAPNTWNISPTYDTKRFSMRIGMTYDDAMIYSYQYHDLAYATDANGNPTIPLQTVPNPQVNGTRGPGGDNYLYAHFQFDTQASYNLPAGFQVYAYGLNLNNEVFGFYNGSTQYMVQREYYHPTYAGGIRWTFHE
jgi:TonB-dependent receptor